VWVNEHILPVADVRVNHGESRTVRQLAYGKRRLYQQFVPPYSPGPGHHEFLKLTGIDLGWVSRRPEQESSIRFFRRPPLGCNCGRRAVNPESNEKKKQTPERQQISRPRLEIPREISSGLNDMAVDHFNQD
jgi:hypothetical protein